MKVRFLICPDVLDAAWCAIFCVLFLGLLSSSLLLLFVTQRFGRCIFRASSGAPILPGYEIDLTREIIFNVWRFVKKRRLRNLKMISLKSFPYLNNQGTPEEESRRIQRPKCCVTKNKNKDEDNSPKNNKHNQILSKIWIHNVCFYLHP